jgi:general secretion pathway protein C
MVSYVSWGANILLFVAGCFLAANTVNAVFAAMLTRPSGPVVARDAPTDNEARTWAQRQVILDRNLFHSSTVDPPILDELEEDVEPTRLPLDLLGTAAGDDPALAWAAITDRETRETLIVSLGDVLKEKAKVIRIERRRVLLSEGGARRELTFGDAPPAAQPVRRSPRTAARRTPRRTPMNRVAVPRRDVEAALAPKQEDGELIGIEVNAIKSGSVLSDVGLENGDLITEFNGVPVSSPEESGRLIQELGDADEINLVVEGPDGQTRTIVVDPNG